MTFKILKIIGTTLLLITITIIDSSITTDCHLCEYRLVVIIVITLYISYVININVPYDYRHCNVAVIVTAILS